MADKKTNNFVFVLVLLFFLLVIVGVAVYTKPKPTGLVIGPTGEPCDGDWICGDWGNCTDGNQTRECTSNNSLNCTSPIIEYQECVGCVENWTCTEWSNCTDGNQTRTCEDANACGTEENKPELIQTCTVVCVENWTCADWSECADDLQNRTCTDSASCGTEENKPAESQSCTMPAVCGDESCDGDEDCANCPEDCGECEEEEESEEGGSSGTEGTGGIITGSTVACVPSWECTGWSECIDKTQSRTCEDVNNCGTEEEKPAVSQSCEPPETCFDGIKNQDEKGIDCGGVCEKRCGFFTMAGNVINTPKEFFLENKIKSIILLGILVLGAGGFVAFRILKKKNSSLLREIEEKLKLSS